MEGAVVRLPSLADCKEIVPELFFALLQRHGGARAQLSAGVAERLCLHGWPLNVRELEMLALKLTSSGEVGSAAMLSALGERGAHAEHRAPPADSEAREAIAVPGRPGADAYYEESEMRALVAALAACGGNVSKAAQSLGLSRPKAYRMLGAATRAGLVT